MNHKNKLFVSLLLISLLATSCLKTRAQLKDDSSDQDNGPSKPVPSEVQEVQPQGQYAIDEIKGELTRLNGRIEELERNSQQANANKDGANANKDEVKKLETRIVELEQAQAAMLDAIKKMQASAPPPNADEVFEKGRAKFDAGDLAGATENFASYLKVPKGKHSEDATFLLGESHYGLKQYKSAIVSYSKFTESFPKSKRMPLVLYRIGLSFEALGMKDDAKNFFQEILDKYPRSPEAKKVKVHKK